MASLLQGVRNRLKDRRRQREAARLVRALREGRLSEAEQLILSGVDVNTATKQGEEALLLWGLSENDLPAPLRGGQ